MKWSGLVAAISLVWTVSGSTAAVVDNTFNIGSGADGLVEQVLELPDRKVLICGNFTSFNGKDRAYIARLNSDGSVDLSFRAHPGYWVRHMAVQTDGKIVISGYFTTVQGTSRNLIARLNSDGSLDPTFDPGTGADVIIAGGIDGNFTPFIFWHVIQPDGKIVITGNFREYNGTSVGALARLNPDGSLDPSFNPGRGLNSWGRVIYLGSNDQIYVGGWFTEFNGKSANRIVRLNADGSHDASFNAFYGDKTAVYSIVELPDGKLITSGHSKNPDGLFDRNVVRLNRDGTVDPSWKGATNEKTESLLLLPNGQLILAGYFGDLSGAARKKIGRLNPDGTVDQKFYADVDNFVWTVAPAQGNKILISGGFTMIDGIPRARVARLNLPEAVGPISVVPAPVMSNARVEHRKFRVTVATIPGHDYTLEATDRPSGPWTSLLTSKAIESTLEFEDPAPGTQRFYRVSGR